MTSQNQPQKDPKTPGKPHGDSAPKAAEPSEVERELTDEETAAVTGGNLQQQKVRVGTS